MSRYVVYESHTINDDKCEMPDMGDFEGLEKSIASLRRRCSDFVSSETLASKLNTVSSDLQDLSSQIASQKDDMLKVLSTGKWKHSLMSGIEDSIKHLEERYASINKELSAKIEEMTALGDVENAIGDKIVCLQSSVREIIRNETSAVSTMLEDCKDSLCKASEKLEECRLSAEKCSSITTEVEAVKSELRKETDSCLSDLKSLQQNAGVVANQLTQCDKEAKVIQGQLEKTKESKLRALFERVALVAISVLCSWLLCRISK